MDDLNQKSDTSRRRHLEAAFDQSTSITPDLHLSTRKSHENVVADTANQMSRVGKLAEEVRLAKFIRQIE